MVCRQGSLLYVDQSGATTAVTSVPQKGKLGRKRVGHQNKTPWEHGETAGSSDFCLGNVNSNLRRPSFMKLRELGFYREDALFAELH